MLKELSKAIGKGKNLIIHSNYHDPVINMAIEEYFLDAMIKIAQKKPKSIKEKVLLLYRNSPSIIIGRTQNPWTEVNYPESLRKQIKIYRRISGGGTVYHDKGNINFCIISSILKDSSYDKGLFLNKLITKFNIEGIKLIRGKRDDLLHDGFKISGSSFKYKQGIMLHHGTLLVDTSLSMMNQLLKSHFRKYMKSPIRSPSVPSKTRNLKNYLPKNYNPISYSIKLIMEADNKILDNHILIELTPDYNIEKNLQKKIDYYRSDPWIYWKTPTFTYQDPVTKSIVKYGGTKSYLHN